MISLMPSCELLRDIKRPGVVSDSYCCAYQQVIVSKGDGEIKAKRGVKERLATNELTYRKFCSAEIVAQCPNR